MTTRVVITGGDAKSRSAGVLRVPKHELVSSLQIALETKRLRIAPELPLAEVFVKFVKEFQGFKLKISLGGLVRFGKDKGARREADHDDLVLATSLATWVLETPNRSGIRRLRASYGMSPNTAWGVHKVTKT